LCYWVGQKGYRLRLFYFYVLWHWRKTRSYCSLVPSGCDVAYTRLEKDGPKTGVGGGWKSVAWHDGYSPGPVVYPAMLSGPSLLHCTLSCGEVYCNRPCLFVCGCVCGSVTTTTQNCVRRSSPNFELVRKGSNHLQLVKFWPSRTPGKGVCGGAKIFGSALIQAARSVCFFQSCISVACG